MVRKNLNHFAQKAELTASINKLTTKFRDSCYNNSDGGEQRAPEVRVAVVLRNLELLLLPQLVVELEDELSEDERAHVEGENVKEPPIPEHEPVGYVIQNVTDSILKHESDSLITGAFARSEISLCFPHIKYSNLTFIHLQSCACFNALSWQNILI